MKSNIENELDKPEKMLETLKLAYQFALDSAVVHDQQERRLSSEEEKELGRRLAYYWELKN